MAVAKATSVTQRRFVYGANVAVQIALVVAVAVGAVYAARDRGQVDLTRSGVNSLSKRTEALLRNLDQDVTITALYTVLSEYDTRAQKRRDAVRDLLRLYESAGRGRVTANLIDPMKDRARLPVLLKRLREKPAYQDEARPHQEALAALPELNERIRQLIDGHVARIEELVAATPELRTSALAEVGQELGRLRRKAEDVSVDLGELTTGDIPFYGRAVETARTYLETVQRWMQAVGDWVARQSAGSAGLSAEALAFLQQANRDYQALLPDVSGQLERMRDLKRVELENLAEQLNRWVEAPPILVETGERAAVLSFAEVWPFRSGPDGAGPDGDEREFAGEQAVSSAILRLTQKEKTAVVFTRFGGPSPIIPDFSQMSMMRRLPEAPYGALNELLRKENFITEDWDVATQKTPPTVADAARTVYVVFPPTPPPQPDPRRPAPQPAISPDDVRIVREAVESAGMAIFLAGASSRLMGGSGNYEFADYLESEWGIEVLHDYLTLRFAPSAENPELFVLRRPPVVIDTEERSARCRLTDHAITAPLRGSVAGFMAACPLRIAAGPETRPAGVQVHPLAVVAPTTDVWAVRDVARVDSDLSSQRGTRPYEDDLKPPFPLAVAAEKGQTQRLVVFGSSAFAANTMLEAPGGYAFTSAGLVPYPAYPANPDLFINAVHWLTREADRISVGARRTEVPRLTELKEGFWMDFWRVFLVGIWPGLALLVGGGVWLFRRR